MQVFNLTKHVQVYRRRDIPPNGGSIDIPNLELTPKDDLLATNRTLAFGSLPAWWTLRVEEDRKKEEATVAGTRAALKVEVTEDSLAPTSSVTTSLRPSLKTKETKKTE